MKFLRWLKKQIKYFTEDIWHIPLADMPKRKSFLIREIRILIIAFRGFTEDKVQLRASALTFYTLLSIVPIVALAFGIAQGFGFDKKLEGAIIESFEGHETVMLYILNLVREFFRNIEPGLMAIIGLAILVWSVMQVLSHIEKSFNHIWQIKKSRPWGRKFADYISIMLFAPLFLVLSGSVSVYITTALESISAKIVIFSTLKPAIIYLLRFTPFFIMWIVFTLLYIIMPNTRVRFRSGLVAGVIAGTIFQAVQFLYLDLQLGVTRYNAVYGSFAAFPLFIVWMQISWLIVLLGAELSFANQNVKKYEYEYQSLNISSAQKRILSLVILNIIIKRFINAEMPVSATIIAEELKIPVRLSREIIYNLNICGIVTEIISEEHRERLYQPALDPAKLTVHYVLTKLDNIGSAQLPVLENRAYNHIVEVMNRFSDHIQNTDGNLLVGEI